MKRGKPEGLGNEIIAARRKTLLRD